MAVEGSTGDCGNDSDAKKIFRTRKNSDNNDDSIVSVEDFPKSLFRRLLLLSPPVARRVGPFPDEGNVDYIILLLFYYGAMGTEAVPASSSPSSSWPRERMGNCFTAQTI